MFKNLNFYAVEVVISQKTPNDIQFPTLKCIVQHHGRLSKEYHDAGTVFLPVLTSLLIKELRDLDIDKNKFLNWFKTTVFARDHFYFNINKVRKLRDERDFQKIREEYKKDENLERLAELIISENIDSFKKYYRNRETIKKEYTELLDYVVEVKEKAGDSEILMTFKYNQLVDHPSTIYQNSQQLNKESFLIILEKKLNYFINDYLFKASDVTLPDDVAEQYINLSIEANELWNDFQNRFVFEIKPTTLYYRVREFSLTQVEVIMNKYQTLYSFTLEQTLRDLIGKRMVNKGLLTKAEDMYQ